MDLKIFENLATEKTEIEQFLAAPDAFSDPDFAAKSRRLAEIEKILNLKSSIDQHEKLLAETRELTNDPELGS